MLVAVKFNKHGDFAGVLGTFSNLAQLKSALATKVVEKPIAPNKSVEERIAIAKKEAGKPFVDQIGATLKFYDAPPDDYAHLLENCPEFQID